MKTVEIRGDGALYLDGLYVGQALQLDTYSEGRQEILFQEPRCGQIQFLILENPAMCDPTNLVRRRSPLERWEYRPGTDGVYGATLPSVTEELNRIGESDMPIPGGLDAGIGLEIANEQDANNRARAMSLIKDGLLELKRRKLEIKQKARELKAMKSALRADKQAFLNAANNWGVGE